MTEKHPGYTSHGHPIPGACGIAGQRPKYVVRCGGPRFCDTCSWEAERYNESRVDSNEPPTMTDQTPTTEEHATVRLGTEIQRYAEGFPRSDFARVSDALATHDRAVKAEALREAADHWQDSADHNTPADIDPEWLRARANRIEADRG